MKLVKVDEIPVGRGEKKNELAKMIDEFMNSELNCVEALFDKSEYESAKSCYTAIYTAIRQSKRRCKVFTSKGHVYLKKLD